MVTDYVSDGTAFGVADVATCQRVPPLAALLWLRRGKKNWHVGALRVATNGEAEVRLTGNVAPTTRRTLVARLG